MIGTWIDLGTINIGTKAIAIDPCYNPSEYYCCWLENMKPGPYECKVFKGKLDTWGERIAGVRITHKRNPNAVPNEEKASLVGVDSGQAGIFDLNYYYDNYESEEWYHRNCDITLKKELAGIIDSKGVVSSSGIGDGIYIVKIAKNKKGQIVAAQINFI